MHTTSIVCVGKGRHQRYCFSSAERMQIQGAHGVCALRALVFTVTVLMILLLNLLFRHMWGMCS